jgi:hypothetical protein
LAFATSNGLSLVPQLNFELERQTLIEAMKDSPSGIDIHFDIATADRFGSFLANSQGGLLHFSGHGDPHFLAIESDGWGGMQKLHVAELEELVAHGQKVGEDCRGLEFAFVSACHSRSIGNAFVASGVPHVVCCESDIRNDVSCLFQKSFYRALANGKTVLRAFEVAKSEVLISNLRIKAELDEQVELFCLLPKEEDHGIQLFMTSSDDPKARSKGTKLRKSTVPAPPTPFLGRQLEIYQIVQSMRRARLVRVTGPSGIGKKALVKATCRFIEDRRHILGFDDVLWIPSFFRQEHSELHGSFERLLDKTQSTKENEAVSYSLINYLRHRSLVLVIEAKESEGIPLFLEMLFEYDESTKVILIHSPDDKLACRNMPCIEKNVVVSELDVRSSIGLFGAMCPEVEDTEAFQDRLLKVYCNSWLWQNDLMHSLGEGNPRKIMAAAKKSTDSDLTCLLDIGEFKSRTAVLRRQEQIKEDMALATEQENFEWAEHLQRVQDKLEKLIESFPDLAALESRLSEIHVQIEKSIKAKNWALARKLSIGKERLKAKIAAEKSDMEKYCRPLVRKVSDDQIDLLDEDLRSACEANDLPKAEKINEKTQEIEDTRTRKECQDKLECAITDLQVGLEDSESQQDWHTASRINTILLKARDVFYGDTKAGFILITWTALICNFASVLLSKACVANDLPQMADKLSFTNDS